MKGLEDGRPQWIGLINRRKINVPNDWTHGPNKTMLFEWYCSYSIIYVGLTRIAKKPQLGLWGLWGYISKQVEHIDKEMPHPSFHPKPYVSRKPFQQKYQLTKSWISAKPEVDRQDALMNRQIKRPASVFERPKNIVAMLTPRNPRYQYDSVKGSATDCTYCSTHDNWAPTKYIWKIDLNQCRTDGWDTRHLPESRAHWYIESSCEMAKTDS